MRKYRILIETITYSLRPNDPDKKSNGTGVSHQLIECDTREEAEEVFDCAPKMGVGGEYVRNAFKLYR